MSPGAITVEDDRGPFTARCWPTPTPGLVIVDYDGFYNVTHERSGLAVVKTRHPEAAMAVAVHLLGVADWTLPAVEIPKDVAGPTREVMRKFGGYQCGPYDANSPRMTR